MRKIQKRLLIVATALAALPIFATGSAAARTDADSLLLTETESVVKVRRSEKKSRQKMEINDRFMPTSRRIDREINKNKYVYKGETMLGLTASYGTFNSEDADMFPVFDDIDIRGTVAAVNPFIGYFYHDNQCVGLRLGYTHLKGDLDNLGLNLGDLLDMDIAIPQINLASDRYSVGMFHRSYVALDDRGRFGVFGEFEAMVTWGANYFAYATGDSFRQTNSDIVNLKLMFSPGVAVYAFPNVCATLSFGLGGFKYNYVRQYDGNGVLSGERHFSQLKFRLNLADIRLGLNIHLWNKKKGQKLNTAL